MIPKIKWIEIGINDFKFEFKNYMLRVERMRPNVWWHQVYFGNIELMPNTQSTNKGEAIRKTQKVFLDHFKKRAWPIEYALQK